LLFLHSIATTASTKETGLSSCSSNTISPSFCSLDLSKNQRQRFYIDTLASVAASFLSDIQATKNNVLQTNSHELNTNNPTSKASREKKEPKPVTTSTATSTIVPPKPKQQALPEAVSGLVCQKSPPKLPGSPSNASNFQRQLLNEEQTSKTKKLLSDLNSKRRSRQRKQIMVVNTSNNQSPRNGLGMMLMPNLNLNMDLNQISCQLNISPQSSNNSNSINETTNQTNTTSAGMNLLSNQIVCSGMNFYIYTCSFFNMKINHLLFEMEVFSN